MVYIRKPKKTRSKETENKTETEMRLVRAYGNKLPLSDNKKKDLKEPVDQNIIPKFYFNC